MSKNKHKISNSETIINSHIPCVSVLPDTTTIQRALGNVFTMAGNFDLPSEFTDNRKRDCYSRFSSKIIASNRPSPHTNNTVIPESWNFSFPHVDIENDKCYIESTTFINTSMNGENVYIKNRDTLPAVVRPFDPGKGTNILTSNIVNTYRVLNSKDLTPNMLYVIKTVPITSHSMKDIETYLNHIASNANITDREFKDVYTATTQKHIDMCMSVLKEYKEKKKEDIKSYISLRRNSSFVSSEFSQEYLESNISSLGVIYVVYEISLNSLCDNTSEKTCTYYHNLDIVVSKRRFELFDEHPSRQLVKHGFTIPQEWKKKHQPHFCSGINYWSNDPEGKSIYYIDNGQVLCIPASIKPTGNDSDFSELEKDSIVIYRQNKTVHNYVSDVVAKETVLSIEEALEQYIIFKNYDDACNFINKRDLFNKLEVTKAENELNILQSKSIITNTSTQSAIDNRVLEIELLDKKKDTQVRELEAQEQAALYKILTVNNQFMQSIVDQQAVAEKNTLEIKKMVHDSTMLEQKKVIAQEEIKTVEMKNEYSRQQSRNEAVVSGWKIIPATIVGAAALAAAFNKFSK